MSSLVPKDDQNLDDIGYDEIVSRLLYIHYQTLCSERYLDLLVTMKLDRPCPWGEMLTLQISFLSCSFVAVHVIQTRLPKTIR